MDQNLSDMYDLIEHAIDNAFEGQMIQFYQYLKDNKKLKKHVVDLFH